MAESASALLARLDKLHRAYGAAAAAEKRALLRALALRRLDRPARTLRLHEILCFLRAYPDDPEVLSQVEALLGTFSRRSDLRRHREALADTGIAGTAIHYRFFWPMARWLARRWPGQIRIEWEEFENAEQLAALLGPLMPYCESPGLDEYAFETDDWIRRLKGRDETDAAFLVRRFQPQRMSSFWQEKLFDRLDVPMALAPGPGTPARTHARWPVKEVVFQSRPLDHGRPDLRKAVRRRPLSVRRLSPRDGQRLVDLACEAMVTRSRDLDVFSWADPRDVRLIDCGEGLQLAAMSAIPQRRLLLEAVYGYLTLKNGIPVGYVLTSSLFGSTEVAFNVFETYRGAEAAAVFGRVLATCRALFGSDSFSLDPYQLGHDNQEGLSSGAWWFYYKLGFRPHAAEQRRLVRRELEKMRARPSHRTSLDLLQRISAVPMFFHLGKPRSDVLQKLSPGSVGLHVSRYLARRFGSDRENGVRTCAEEAARLLGARSRRGFSPGERLAWERWSPLVLSLGEVERWPPADRKALAAVMRAKGGRSENDFVALFDRHRRLRRAVARLARPR